MWNVETYTKLHWRTAYGIFLSFSNTLKVNETPQKKFNFLLKIISATKKIPEVNVLVVLMENCVCLTLQQLAFFVFKSQSDYNHLASKKSAFRCRYKHQSKVIIKEKSCKVVNLTPIFSLWFPFPPSSYYSHLFSVTLVKYEVAEKQLHDWLLIEDIKSLMEVQRSLTGFSPVDISCHKGNKSSNLEQR